MTRIMQAMALHGLWDEFFKIRKIYGFSKSSFLILLMKDTLLKDKIIGHKDTNTVPSIKSTLAKKEKF